MDEGISERLIVRERTKADVMRVILDDSKLTNEAKARIVYRILNMAGSHRGPAPKDALNIAK